jgi:predicted AAA+ superfamily ATPase
MAIGGMPAAVNAWLRTQSSRTVRKTHQDLLDSYQQDFNKYAAKHQLKYLDLLFRYALVQLGRKFIYSKIGEYQKRELEPALGLLQKAGLLHPIFRTSGQGIPLGAGIHLDDFKIMFFDVGLSQALLQRDITSWFINPLEIFVNKGELTEVFIGQEILAYADPIAKQHLFYWRREQRNSQAEIDYLIQLHERVVPIEVKAGMSEQLKSMSLFLDSHPHSPYGIHLSARPFNMAPRLHTYPLYAVAKLFFDNNDIMRKALSDLVRVKTEK